MMMDVAVCYGPREIGLERRALEQAGPGEVLVKVAYCGVCPWDLRVFSGLSSSVRYPLQMGHEISGVVEQAGEGVHGLRAGDPVVVDAIRRCGTCVACRRGHENHCEHADYSRGGFAQYILASASNVYPLRPTTPLLEAALTEPLACITRAQNRVAAKPGSTALVLGCGPLGLLHAQLLKQRGARVVVSDPRSYRLEVALALGVDVAINPAEVDLVRIIANETEGWGVDAAIVATGAIGAVRQALPLLSADGTLLLFAGIYPQAELALDPNLIHYRELWITGSADYTRAEFRQALSLIEEGVVQIEPLITDIVPLGDIAAALETINAGSGLKVVVQCNDQEWHGQDQCRT
jgi:L-iditol 2-dehydrogenase